MICDKCGYNLTLLNSNIQGLGKVIDIYYCPKCQIGKTIVTKTNIEIPKINISDIGNFNEDDYEEVLEQSENPYEDNDGGWDPSIG